MAIPVKLAVYVFFCGTKCTFSVLDGLGKNGCGCFLVQCILFSVLVGHSRTGCGWFSVKYVPFLKLDGLGRTGWSSQTGSKTGWSSIKNGKVLRIMNFGINMINNIYVIVQKQNGQILKYRIIIRVIHHHPFQSNIKLFTQFIKKTSLKKERS